MVFGLFRKRSAPKLHARYADVVVVSLPEAAYYADARDELIRVIGEAISESPTGRVVIEMSCVRQFTSGPLGALVVSARKASEKGGRLVLAAAVSEFVGKVLSTAMETRESPAYPTVRAALASLSTGAAAEYDTKG